MTTCYLCQQPRECRPYGPRGESICFDCAMAPENKAATEMMVGKLMDACGDVVALDRNGPRPATAAERKMLQEGGE